MKDLMMKDLMTGRMKETNTVRLRNGAMMKILTGEMDYLPERNILKDIHPDFAYLEHSGMKILINAVALMAELFVLVKISEDHGNGLASLSTHVAREVEEVIMMTDSMTPMNPKIKGYL